MEFLKSGIVELKFRLLEKITRPRDNPAPDFLPSETTALHQAAVYRAVEERICRRIDLARRADLTDRQAIDALRLLTGIVRRSGLSIDFSDGEIALLTRGLPCRMPTFRLKKTLT